MTVYLDVIFLLNMICNGMILLLTRYLVRSNTSKKRILFSTLIASFIIFFQGHLSNSLLFSLSIKILYSMVIILVAFGYGGIISFIKKWTLFYFISFSIGGAILGVHYLLEDVLIYGNHQMMLTAENIYGEEIHLSFILVAFPIFWYFTKRRMDEHVETKIKYDQYYEVILTLNGQSIRTKGYLDSGNHLIDPITRRPVVLCDTKFLNKFFNEEDWNTFITSIAEEELSIVPPTLEQKLFIVPFQGVGGITNYLYCLKPEALTIFYQGKILETSRVLVGIQLQSLTENNAYHCLLHPQLIYFSNENTAS